MIESLFSYLERFRTSFPTTIPGKPPSTLLGFVAHYAKPFWPLILISAIFSTVIALIEVWLFAFVGRLVDWIADSSPQTLWDQHGTQLLFVGVIVVILLPFLKLLYEATINQGMLGNFAMRTRWDAHRYLLRQSVSFFQDDFAGRIATKMMQTSLGVRDAVMKVTEVLLYVTVYFGGAVVMFASSDIRMTFPMLAWLLGYIIALRVFIPKLRDVSMEQADARSMVTGRVVDSYTNISTVKMFAHTRHEDRYAQEGMEVFLQTVYRQMRLATYLTVTLSTMNAVLLFSVAAMGIWLWQESTVTAGSIAFAVGLVLRLQGMSQWILWEVSSLFENIGVVQDGIETISNDISIVDQDGARPLQMKGGSIRFQDVTFNYQKASTVNGAGVLQNLNLDISPGEKIGIVGRSGAGKSTLVNLLLRFHDVEHGEITIDGQNVSAVTQDSLRQAIGMVTQDTSLLHRSVRDNIRYGRQAASNEDVTAAAKRARAHDFILDLEDQEGRTAYDAHTGERGVKLSGGQRQRIAIARILLKDAPILILDEATSALDSEVEAAIQESLYELMHGKTVLAIAHRLSTIAAMDRLIVMDNGKIVESGNHSSLIARGGLYASLWSRQSGGFLSIED
ncbi:MAG: ABC transporter ATP-binding protein [Pseudomonadota bacterium]